MSQANQTVISAPAPQRGEVWRANLEPIEGSEQGKTRPVVVMSAPTTGHASTSLCAPVIHRKPLHARLFWCVELAPETTNGLTKNCSADAAQARVLDHVRFEIKLGQITPDELEAVTTALCLCVERVPVPTQPVPAQPESA